MEKDQNYGDTQHHLKTEISSEPSKRYAIKKTLKLSQWHPWHCGETRITVLIGYVVGVSLDIVERQG